MLCLTPKKFLRRTVGNLGQLCWQVALPLLVMLRLLVLQRVELVIYTATPRI
jgi:hypothetical protein